MPPVLIGRFSPGRRPGGRSKEGSPTLAGMADQTYLVALKPPSRAIQHVVASIVGVRDRALPRFSSGEIGDRISFR
jgi:hypothetical protein